MRIPETGTDGTPLAPHARRKLEDRLWRLKRAWWILPSLFSVGVLGFVGFVWAGIKTSRKKYYISGVIWLVVSLLVVVLPEGPAIPVVAVIAWFGPAIQAAFMHPAYLVERAEWDV